MRNRKAKISGAAAVFLLCMGPMATASATNASTTAHIHVKTYASDGDALLAVTYRCSAPAEAQGGTVGIDLEVSIGQPGSPEALAFFDDEQLAVCDEQKHRFIESIPSETGVPFQPGMGFIASDFHLCWTSADYLSGDCARPYFLDSSKYYLHTVESLR